MGRPDSKTNPVLLYRHSLALKFYQLGGVPVLFIPGNAGSSRQARSIASSATRQYYESPHKVASAFAGKQAYRPLDLYTRTCG